MSSCTYDEFEVVYFILTSYAWSHTLKSVTSTIFSYFLYLNVRTGKDRTGLIAMLTLHIVGASDEEIIADYVLSDSAYKDIKDSKAMVVAMKQVTYRTHIRKICKYLQPNQHNIHDSPTKLPGRCWPKDFPACRPPSNEEHNGVLKNKIWINKRISWFLRIWWRVENEIEVTDCSVFCILHVLLMLFLISHLEFWLMHLNFLKFTYIFSTTDFQI